ncbi:hypothetical protein PQX77_006882 [Marasmius sp. AFHP31]|nr:hypothetical protein PQX77_006882 [Marasmius sp. AFHP31]
MHQSGWCMTLSVDSTPKKRATTRAETWRQYTPQIKDPVESKKTHKASGYVHPEANCAFGRVLYNKLTKLAAPGRWYSDSAGQGRGSSQWIGDGFLIERYTAILGYDIAGDVAKVGEGLQSFKVGDRVTAQKALFLTEKHGDFVVNTRDIPTPAAGEILVQVKGVALNPSDWKIRDYGVLIEEYPAILGSDVAGDVAKVGEGVQSFKVGDRVVFQGYFENDHAGFQQFITIPAEIVAKIPKSLTYSQAASIPLGLATAALGLFWTVGGASLNPNLDENIQYPGKPAVVIGGATSVGQFAIQLLKFVGFSPIITYASGHHTEFLKTLGATDIIDRKSVAIQDLPTEVEKITDTPVRIVYDAVSQADTEEAGYATLAEGGDLVLVLPSQIKNPVEGKKIHNVVGNVPQPDRAFGRVLYSKLTKFLEDGIIVPNRVEDLPNGLAGIADGLDRLRKDQVSGLKLIALPHEPL